jgi:hypothetical protein
MPKAFMRCARGGGRVRTKRIGAGKAIKLCFSNGRSYAGESFKLKKRGRGR